MRFQASALVRRMTSAVLTSLHHHSLNSLNDTAPSFAVSNSSMSSSTLRSMPRISKACCSSRGSRLPFDSMSNSSKIIRTCCSDKACNAKSPVNTVLRPFMACCVSSSTSEHNATPRMTDPSVGSMTWTASWATSLVCLRNGGKASVRPSMPAVRPPGMTMILSTMDNDFATSLMCPSTKLAHVSKSGVPGCGGVNLLPTIQPDMEVSHVDVKRAFKGEFLTRTPLLKSTAPMCLPMVQINTSWSRHMSSPALAPKVSWS
mmetsp:Transcript_29501/g.66831  ORF Transcript_29501/g.66831 Transcript_29501/m.66831 type:complete len:260 (-) Transcript_29501:534-1313(-)